VQVAEVGEQKQELLQMEVLVAVEMALVQDQEALQRLIQVVAEAEVAAKVVVVLVEMAVLELLCCLYQPQTTQAQLQVAQQYQLLEAIPFLYLIHQEATQHDIYY
jgi:hypothetical protein